MKLAKIKERQAFFLALAVNDKIWDDTLGQQASYRELITHPDPKLCDVWLKSGENKFGQLFQGFPPNGKIADGIGVLDWISKTVVPKDKKVTYPRYTVANCHENCMNLIALASPVAVMSLTTSET